MSSDPRKTIRELSTEIDSDLASFSRELHHMLRTTTPIATGRARDGWRNDFKTGKVGKGGNLQIASNRVPYIDRLDKGWSRQAPKGIVDEAVKKTRNNRR